jgi:hypothetical protein
LERTWCHSQRDARTNNMCEGWNNKFFNLVGHAHPYLSSWCVCQVVETALVVDVATKYSCNCTKDCIFKVWTLNCRLLAWQLSTIDWKSSSRLYRCQIPWRVHNNCQQPTVPAIRQRPECRKQNVSLLCRLLAWQLSTIDWKSSL